MNKIKTIRLKSGTYDANHFDYVSNGIVLFTVSKKNRTLLETVPKKYYMDIFLENHTVSDCGFRNTIPSTFNRRLKGAKYIEMERIV